MKLVFVDPRVVDCTSDPHWFSYDSAKEIMEAIRRVVESDLCFRIRVVNLSIGPEETAKKYESDYLSMMPGDKVRQLMTNEAKDNKTYGLFLSFDAGCDRGHLPLGLSGVRAALDVLGKALKENPVATFRLSIGVIWRFAMGSSCSDYIEWESESLYSVNFGNQDWWESVKGYREHLEALEKIAGGECDDLYDQCAEVDEESGPATEEDFWAEIEEHKKWAKEAANAG